MKKSDKMISSLDDLAAFCANQTEWNAKASYKLCDVTNKQWDDPVAGEKWQDALHETYNFYPNTQEGKEAKNLMHDAVRDRKPAQQQITRWWLDSEAASNVDISQELAAQIKAIWTTRTSRFNLKEPEMTGRLTIAGICRRLGRGDAGKEMKAAQAAAEVKKAREHRNLIRSNITSHVETLKKYVTERGPEAGIKVSDDTWALIAKLVNTEVESWTALRESSAQEPV